MKWNRAGIQRNGSGRLGRVICWGAVVLAAGAFGCSPSDKEINEFVQYWEADVSAAEYRVQPPDGLQISAAQAPEIDGEVQVIRSDGKISLRLVGEVKVAGLTPTEIAHKIELLLAKYYVEPQVSVRVQGTESKRFYVFGQVGRSGAFRYTGRDTVLTALADASPNFIAWKSQIKVIHPSHEDGKRHEITVDAEKMTQEGRLEQNVMLQEGDIVYVPPTPLGWVGLRLQELLYPVAPAAQAVVTPAFAANTIDEEYVNRDSD